jgi:hypothetical protein
MPTFPPLHESARSGPEASARNHTLLSRIGRKIALGSLALLGLPLVGAWHIDGCERTRFDPSIGIEQLGESEAIAMTVGQTVALEWDVYWSTGTHFDEPFVLNAEVSAPSSVVSVSAEIAECDQDGQDCAVAQAGEGAIAWSTTAVRGHFEERYSEPDWFSIWEVRAQVTCTDTGSIDVMLLAEIAPGEPFRNAPEAVFADSTYTLNCDCVTCEAGTYTDCESCIPCTGGVDYHCGAGSYRTGTGECDGTGTSDPQTCALCTGGAAWDCASMGAFRDPAGAACTGISNADTQGCIPCTDCGPGCRPRVGGECTNTSDTDCVCG